MGGGGIIFNMSRYRDGSGIIIAPGGIGGAGLGDGEAGTNGNEGHLDIATF